MAAPKTYPARDRILETADRLFYAEGLRAVGIDRIIAEAGVAKMTLYAHFPSKDDLILAVLQYREAKVVAFFAEAVGRHWDREGSRLRAFFAALKEWFGSDGFRGCAFQNATAELADPAHPGTAFVRGHKRRFHAMLAGFAADAAGDGGTHIGPALAILVEGAVVAAVVEGSPAAADVARDAALRLLSGLAE